jgi:hypothetical protein
MIKKLFLIILLIVPFTMRAQYGEGDWKIHPVFGSSLSNVVDAGDNVYYLVNSNLYRFNKATLENEALNKRNLLSGVNISQIYYNSSKKYLVVVYDDANIDIILPTGKIKNLPYIKDAIMAHSKLINNVTFAGDEAYVATDFGYIVINDSKFEVKESHLYGTSLSSVAVVGKWLFVTADSILYYSPLADEHNKLSSFKNIKEVPEKLMPVNDSSFFVTAKTLSLYKIGPIVNDTMTFTKTLCYSAIPTTLQKTATGFVANFFAKNIYITFDANGENAKTTTAASQLFSSTESDGSWWTLSAKGLRHLVGTVYSSYYKPDGLAVNIPFWMAFNKPLNKLFVTNTGTNAFFSAQSNPTVMNTLQGSTWANETPTNVTLKGTYYPIFDPEDSTTYYLGSWFSGLYKITNGKVVMTYNWTNSPLTHALNYYCHAISALDKNGNMWIVQTGNSTTPVMVLPREKLKLTTVTSADWYTPSIPNISGNKRASFVASKVNNVKVYTTGNFAQPVFFWDDGGDVTTGTVTSKSYANFIDQDGKTYNWTYIYALTEDAKGKIWMGSSNGVISFDPTAAFSDSFTINRIKVPRNDGTSSFDYLLASQQVNCIAVDTANCKWIGTNTAGVYYISADGTKILKHFDTSNSYLSSNQIYQICCNPNSNSVYIITSNGFLEYKPGVTPAEDNYNNVYIFPNPVKPDFTGLITIKGLMDSSYLKITDAEGNVVKSLQSTGGMATWDGCNEAGKHVKSGTYDVHATQNSAEANSAVVAKIMIIR